MHYDGAVLIDTSLGTENLEKDIKEVSGELGGLKGVLQKAGKAISDALSRPVGRAGAEIKKDIDACAKAIEKYRSQIQKAQDAKLPFEDKSRTMGAELDEAKRKLMQLQAQEAAVKNAMQFPEGRTPNGEEIAAYIDAQAQLPAIQEEIAKQQAAVDALEEKWTKACDKVDEYNTEIDQAKDLMAANEAKAAELAEELKEAETASMGLRENGRSVSKEMGKAGKRVRSFTSRLKSIVLGALVFNGISAGLREMTEHFGRCLKTNDAFTKSLAQCKGALLTAFQPIYQAVAPALVYLTKILTAAILSLARLFSLLTGTSLEASAESAENLYKEAEALDKVGSSAKKAGKNLAGFDDLNVMQSADQASSSGNNTTAPVFSWDDAGIARIAEIIEDIAKWAGIAAAGFAGFKLGGFIADLATANTKTTTLKDTLALLGKKTLITLEIGAVFSGLALFAKGIVESFQEGLSGINFAEILGGGALATGAATHLGAQIAAWISSAFAKSAIAKALAAAATNLGVGTAGVAGAALTAAGAGVILGIPMMIAGIYDAIVGGIEWLNTALMGLGATAVGAGAGVLIGAATGAWTGPVGAAVGALIGLVVGLLTAFGIWFWQNFEEIELWFQSMPTWIQSAVGIQSAVAGAASALGLLIGPIIGIITAIKKWDEIKKYAEFLWSTVSSFAAVCWDQIVEYFTPAYEWFSALFGSIHQTLSDIFYNIGVIAGGCWQIIQIAWKEASQWFDANIIQPVAEYFSALWSDAYTWACEAWSNIQATIEPYVTWIDENVIQPISQLFSDLKEDIEQAMSDAAEALKEAFQDLEKFLKDVLNGVIYGLNSGLSGIFGSINKVLTSLKSINIAGATPFAGIRTISVPKIPYLAQGAVLPANKPFMAVVGDQRHGTNVEAPLATIQEALDLALADRLEGMMAGFNAVTARQEQILAAILNLDVSDGALYGAVDRYQKQMAMATGGV